MHGEAVVLSQSTELGDLGRKWEEPRTILVSFFSRLIQMVPNIKPMPTNVDYVS